MLQAGDIVVMNTQGNVNNAGFGLFGAFADLPRESQLAMLDLNVRTLVQLSHGLSRGGR